MTYCQHGLFGTYHPYLCEAGDGTLAPDRSRPNGVFDRPGNDAEDTTELERNLVPAGCAPSCPRWRSNIDQRQRKRKSAYSATLIF